MPHAALIPLIISIKHFILFSKLPPYSSFRVLDVYKRQILEARIMQYSKMNREELEDLKSELKKQYDDVKSRCV